MADKTLAERGLRYIADSPPTEHSGFHPEAVRTAKAALRLIARLRRRIRHFPDLKKQPT